MFVSSSVLNILTVVVAVGPAVGAVVVSLIFFARNYVFTLPTLVVFVCAYISAMLFEFVSYLTIMRIYFSLKRKNDRFNAIKTWHCRGHATCQHG